MVNSAYLIDPQGAFVVLLLLPLSEHQQGNTFLMQFMSNCLQNMELAHLSCGNGLGYHLYSKNVVMFYISVWRVGSGGTTLVSRGSSSAWPRRVSTLEKKNQQCEVHRTSLIPLVLTNILKCVIKQKQREVISLVHYYRRWSSTTNTLLLTNDN